MTHRPAASVPPETRISNPLRPATLESITFQWMTCVYVNIKKHYFSGFLFSEDPGPQTKAISIPWPTCHKPYFPLSERTGLCPYLWVPSYLMCHVFRIQGSLKRKINSSLSDFSPLFSLWASGKDSPWSSKQKAAWLIPPPPEPMTPYL